MKRILVTGSREWTDEDTVREALYRAWVELGASHDIVLVHGGARGADAVADRLWRMQPFPVEVHPANWNAFGKRAGILRNEEMVRLGADLCLAFPIGESRGTRDCIRRAQAAGIPVRVFEGVAQ